MSKHGFLCLCFSPVEHGRLGKHFVGQDSKVFSWNVWGQSKSQALLKSTQLAHEYKTIVVQSYLCKLGKGGAVWGDVLIFHWAQVGLFWLTLGSSQILLDLKKCQACLQVLGMTAVSVFTEIFFCSEESDINLGPQANGLFRWKVTEAHVLMEQGRCPKTKPDSTNFECSLSSHSAEVLGVLCRWAEGWGQEAEQLRDLTGLPELWLWKMSSLILDLFWTTEKRLNRTTGESKTYRRTLQIPRDLCCPLLVHPLVYCGFDLSVLGRILWGAHKDWAASRCRRAQARLAHS